MALRSDPPAVLDTVADRVAVCTQCRLHAARTRAVPGRGPPDARILFLGEAPGKEEDLQGLPFVGRAGRILDRMLEEAGLDRSRVFVTNVVKCRPPGNRKPRADEVEACRPHLLAQIQAIRPALAVTLGATALRDLLGPKAKLKTLCGKVARFGDVPVLVTYHPAAVLYNRNLERALARDLRHAARMVRVVTGTKRGRGRRAKR